jgi:hypothetical protein
VSARTDFAEQPVGREVEVELLRGQRELLAYVENKAGSASEPSFSARSRSRLPGASAPASASLGPSLGQSAAWAALAPRPHRPPRFPHRVLPVGGFPSSGPVCVPVLLGCVR